MPVHYAIIRKGFPQVYQFSDAKTGNPMFLVASRSKRWGLNDRKTFTNEKDALTYREQILAQIQSNGAQPGIPKDKLVLLKEYESLIERLKPHNKTVTQAVEHYITFLGEEILKQAKPYISELIDKWEQYKKADTTLSPRTLSELKAYSHFIRRKFGKMKPDDLRKNEIDIILKGLPITNTTRRKYLTMLRMFLKWVKDEGFILSNPSDGIYYKTSNNEKRFYTSESIQTFLKYVVDTHKEMTGYYVLLTFCGLRPSEGARVQWDDINFKTGQLYVRPGKTISRHINMEPVTLEWLKWFSANTDKDAPFIPAKNMFNLEREVRENTFGKEWISDGLRHTFATMFKSLKKDINLTADVMGNSPKVIKSNYAQTIDIEELNKFWGLTPENVLNPIPL
jgi:integrase